MATITIPQKEYDELLEAKLRFEYLSIAFNNKEDLFAPPPTKSAGKIVEAFQKENIYSKKFISSLKKGLTRSKHFSS
jgi:hypothetical protein